jgi:hypothetical protein
MAARHTAYQQVADDLGEVPTEVRDRVLFGMDYLTGSSWATPPNTAVVHPGEDEKPRIDRLLSRYQDALIAGRDVTVIRDERVQLLTEVDAATARRRGTAIRDNPHEQFAPLWGKHVDRDELGAAVREYAQMVAHDAATVGDGEPAARPEFVKRLTAARRRIDLMAGGEGLDQIERDQIRCTLADLDAGVDRVPELLFADHRSAPQP